MKILVTGANGFVGSQVLATLRAHGHQVRAAVREPSSLCDEGDIEICAIGSVGSNTRWEYAVKGVDAVVHLAARVHILTDNHHQSLAAFREVNRDGTRALATQAAEAGVNRMVLVSSVKVNGEQTGRAAARHKFRPTDDPCPITDYGISKLEAERVLREVSEQTGMEMVVIRPPLIYGPGVGANFQRLIRWIEKGLPLPFAAVENRRSLAYVENVADLLRLCVEENSAAGQTFMVSDGEDVSTAGLVRLLAEAMDIRPRLLSVSPAALRFLGSLVGRGAEIDRLVGSLQVDTSATRETLGWEPPFTLQQGIERTVGNP